jgi:hypothetical protein
MKHFKFFILFSYLFFSFLCFSQSSPLNLLISTYWGTEEDDDLQSAYEGPDGSIYIVGNLGKENNNIPKGLKVVIGNPVEGARCGRGFIARLSSDFKKILNYTEFSEGIGIFTTVVVNKNGVYIGGYASEGLEDLIKGVPGVMKEYPLKREIGLIKEGKILEANGIFSERDPIEGRPGLGRYGAPFVLLLTHDLKKVIGGTYLEGWQQVWDKDRVKRIKPREFFEKEYFWQPTLISILKDGSVIVCHDGGYFRILTEEDKKIANEISKGDEKIYKEVLSKLSFYDMCDYLSKLSSDLSKREWKIEIYTPEVKKEHALEIKNVPLNHYGSPRTHRMRIDKKENIYLCGWSASATKNEPWWSPYIWVIDSKTGKIIKKLYEYDPMSGNDNRMGGQVADTAVTSLNFDREGNLLVSLLSDGGNSVMWWSPKAELGKRFEGEIKGDKYVKLVHWWGMIHKVNPETCEGIIGVGMTSKGLDAPGPAWVVDLSSLSNNNILCVGRCNHEFLWTENAFLKGNPEENPMCFIRVYDKDMNLLFSSAFPGIIPLELIPISNNRYIVVGYGSSQNNILKNPIFDKNMGKRDGFFAVLEENLWTGKVELPVKRKTKTGEEKIENITGYYWIPENVNLLRGIILSGKILLERRIATDIKIREIAKKHSLMILYFEPHLDALFNYTSETPENLKKFLNEIGEKEKHKEIPYLPFLTIGHSTAGIFARNVGYWAPDRTIGVIHIKSGNLQEVYDKTKSLAGVPFLAINGEFEEYGPITGLVKEWDAPPKPDDPKWRRNQTQWIMIRAQMIERRKRNPNNLMALVIHKGAGHTSWDEDMSEICAKWIDSVCKIRLPKEEEVRRNIENNSYVRCNKIELEKGWLYDADIKKPKFDPGKYDEYRGNKTYAFWVPDEEIAKMIFNYHKNFEQPDPTETWPDEKRYTPPPELMDEIDLKCPF